METRSVIAMGSDNANTYLLHTEDELIATLRREVFLGQELLATVEVLVGLVLVLLWNAVEHVILHKASQICVTGVSINIP